MTYSPARALELLKIADKAISQHPLPWRISRNGNVLADMPNGYDPRQEVCAYYSDDPDNASLAAFAIVAIPDLAAELRSALAEIELLNRASTFRFIGETKNLDGTITVRSVERSISEFCGHRAYGDAQDGGE